MIIYIFCFVFIFLGKLFLLHFWLALQNLTFYEHIKKKWENFPSKNPFDKRDNCKNICSVVFRKQPISKLNLKEKRYSELLELHT